MPGLSLVLPLTQLLNLGRFVDLSFLIYRMSVARHLIRVDMKIRGVAICLCRHMEGSFPSSQVPFIFQLIAFFLMFLIRKDVSALLLESGNGPGRKGRERRSRNSALPPTALTGVTFMGSCLGSVLGLQRA